MIKLILILAFSFLSVNAVMMQEGEFVKQKQELIKLKEELDEFYKEKEIQYKKNKDELIKLDSQIQAKLDDIEKTKKQNTKILDEITQKITSKAMNLYSKMKIKIVKNILQEKLDNGEINEVFDIIVRLKDKRVMELLKKFDSKTSTLLMDKLNKYKNNKENFDG